MGRVYRNCNECQSALDRQREQAAFLRLPRYSLEQHVARCTCACHGEKSA